MVNILSKLEDPGTINTDQLISMFILYYSKNDRHKYHEITVYLIEKFSKTEDGEIIDVILENLKTVMDAVVQKCDCKAQISMETCFKAKPPKFECVVAEKDSDCESYKWLYRKLNKLYDHISLEYTRLGDIRQHNDYVEKLIVGAKEREDKLQKTVNDIDKKIENVTTTTTEFEEKMNETQKDYVTILGIFASIVLAFTGGIAFSTSVLENIDAVSPYRLAAVVIGLAFVLTNVVYILVRFIQEINKAKNEEIKYPKHMMFLNGTLAVLLLITLVSWIIFEKPYNNAPDAKYSVSLEYRIDQPKNSQSN